jgi:hypothetical protein
MAGSGEAFRVDVPKVTSLGYVAAQTAGEHRSHQGHVSAATVLVNSAFGDLDAARELTECLSSVAAVCDDDISRSVANLEWLSAEIMNFEKNVKASDVGAQGEFLRVLSYIGRRNDHR